jgi:4-amino-4-deoxy-L-arabinose transferase-like glycosyltransferase
VRALRLLLGGPPLAMLVGAIAFGALALAQGRWVLTGVLVALALIALGLFMWHRYLMRRLLGR